MTALHYAAMYGRDGCMRTLLSTPGIDVNIKDSTGTTPETMATKDEVHTMLQKYRTSLGKDGLVCMVLEYITCMCPNIQYPSVEEEHWYSYCNTFHFLFIINSPLKNNSICVVFIGNWDLQLACAFCLSPLFY